MQANNSLQNAWQKLLLASTADTATKAVAVHGLDQLSMLHSFAPKVLLSMLHPGVTHMFSPLAQRSYPRGRILHFVSLLLSTSDFSESLVVLLIIDKYLVGNQYSQACTVAESGDLKMKTGLTCQAVYR